MTLTDIGVALLLTLAGTTYALYKGFDLWWIYPLVLGGFVFVSEAVQWYYFDYPQERLREKAEKLAQGEDVDPQLDMGPGFTDPFILTLLGTIITWGLISIHIITPEVGRYPGTYIFLGGTMILLIAISSIQENRKT
ncbi:hypothetical protein C441_18822 [Haloferax sulfurifontis ATCC BAA-897]|uniref:Uncharacterized protein n=2 Tax=Haloferax sulfurifontis TaxID=255616 RepID=M0HYS2_9EURY|nr:hypothetical protein C441_18822 [Haloferax sulfurifontis ATCC BAA-897]